MSVYLTSKPLMAAEEDDHEDQSGGGEADATEDDEVPGLDDLPGADADE